MKRLLLGAVRVYQLCVSPYLGANCRFYPTCSAYARAAVEKYGVWKGSYLSLRRLCKCRPGGGRGYDPLE
jgi:putative membrane protein insertion efficiency factor